MSLLSKLFGSISEPREEKELPWIPLNSEAQLNLIVEKSRQKPQLIFKHSTSCGISRMVLRQFTDVYDFSVKDFDLYYLDLWAYRSLSDEVANRFQVMHQSPQLLIIRDGAVILHDSHGSINSIDLSIYLR